MVWQIYSSQRPAVHRAGRQRGNRQRNRLGAARGVDLRQCRQGNRSANWHIGRKLARPAMLSQTFKSAVAGLMLGLMGLFASTPAVAHGLHRDGHATMPYSGSIVRVEPAPIVVHGGALPGRIGSRETTPGQASAPKEHSGQLVAHSSPSRTELKSGRSPVWFGHAGGCHCCGANGACCGMACCGGAMTVSATGLPPADRPSLAVWASAFLQTTNSDTLLRPPRLA